jgi:hypothetical protein
MSPAGRPKAFPVKKVIGFDAKMLRAIDDWRRLQPDVPTVSDAIRRLVDKALVGTAAKPATAPAAKARAAAGDVPPKRRGS